jgi:hypothetical protein
MKGTFGDNVGVDFVNLKDIHPLPSEKHQYIISELNEP